MKRIILPTETIMKGRLIGEGRERYVYRYKQGIYKIAKVPSDFTNKAEVMQYLQYKNRNEIIYNPILGASEDFEIIEVEKCMPFLDFLVKRAGIKPLEIIRRQEEEGFGMYDMVELVEEYHLEKFLPVSWDAIHEFLFKENNHDWDEIQFYSNWGYNIKRKQLVIVDYAD